MSEERLQEIKDSIDLQEKIMTKNMLVGEEKELYDEVVRLNNIINELEKWLNEEQVIYRDYLIRTPKFDSDYGANHLTLSNLTKVSDKLQELKGDSSNE